MALGSSLTEMSTRSIPGGKGGRCIRLTTLPPSCAVVMTGNLNFLEPSGSLQACNGTALPCNGHFTWTYIHLWSYLAQFFLDWEMFQTEVAEKARTHVICSTIFPRKSCRLWDNRDRPQMTVWRTHFACWITKVRDTHSRMYNTQCFSTATMVMRTRLIVTLYAYFLSCV